MSNISSQSFLTAMQNLINNKSDKNYDDFEQELNKATFLSPVFITNKNNEIELKNSDVSFVNIEDGQGNKMFLAFTDWDKFNKFKKENNFTAIEATVKDFHYLLTNIDKDAKGFVINIGDDALFIPKETFVN